ncbi:MAG: hypothetical protein E6R13_07080 [Spirochaetes bacterium]|nr:MAG: hypothetical protein E6R13_07080 [Spirochaetota bacterium]
MADCKNPFEAYLIKVFNAVNNGATIYDALTSGFTGTTDVYCCQDCGDEYVLAGTDQFYRYYQSTMCNFDKSCCFNYKTTIANYFDMIDYDVPIDKQCCNDFNQNLFDNLYQVVGSNELNVFEYSTINGGSNIGILADILSQYSQSVANEYLNQILFFGVVITCQNGLVIGTTMDGYTDYGAKLARFYNMIESPEYMNGLIECGLFGSPSVTFSATSFIVNGLEMLPSIQTVDIDNTNINWISANNTIVSGCTLGAPTGITYTNFVDFVNDCFQLAGMTEYKAQIALNQNFSITSNYYTGFYLIFPNADDFELTFHFSSGFDITYTYKKNDIISNIPLYYVGMTSVGFTYDCVNDIVIE